MTPVQAKTKGASLVGLNIFPLVLVGVILTWRRCWRTVVSRETNCAPPSVLLLWLQLAISMHVLLNCTKS